MTEGLYKRKVARDNFEMRTKTTKKKFTHKSNDDIEATSGLSKVVDEMLRNYTATSADRRPFWCRICQYQGTDLDDLNTHRQSALHTLAVKRERKLSYCRICKKQFTSPAQLTEHEKGKLHIERLESLKSRNKDKFIW